jgi:predicted HAD superfamily Cof-like phosphohydrolase
MTTSLHQVLEFHRLFSCEIGDPTNPRLPAIDMQEGKALLKANDLLMEARHILRDVCSSRKGGSTPCMRVALIAEETAELAMSLYHEDAVSALDALGDIRYVADGTTISFGMYNVFDEAVDRIHASNLSKLSEEGLPVKDASGKVIKGPNYKAVDLRDLVGMISGEPE